VENSPDWDLFPIRIFFAQNQCVPGTSKAPETKPRNRTMKTKKTQKSHAGHPACISKETAIAQAKKYRKYAEEDRISAQKSLAEIEAQIEAQIANEKAAKARAAMASQSAIYCDALADAFLAHAESITSGKTDS
jgi:hypothetical protein